MAQRFEVNSGHDFTMKMHLLSLCLGALALSGYAHGQSVYKCTNPDGSISYQDRACPGTSKEKKVSVGRSERTARSGTDGKVIPVPEVGEAAVLVFDYMETVVREDGDHSTTMGIRSKPGARNKMSMVLTFKPNRNASIPSRQQQESAIKGIVYQQEGLGSYYFEFQEFEAKSGDGLLTVINDRRYPKGVAPKGEYATITAGQIASDRVVVDLTILTDGVKNKGFADAMTIAKTLVVAPQILAMNNEGTEIKMPEPPAGFSWQQAPEIKGAFLRPNGWQFDTRHEGGDFAYFISREPNVEPDGFDTGLTINVQTNVPAKTGMQPSEYAAKFLQASSGEMELIGEQFVTRNGPMVSHGALYQVSDPEKGDFKAHIVALGNDATGTVYFCIFEGPANEWDEIWKLGEQMLAKLAINHSI